MSAVHEAVFKAKGYRPYRPPRKKKFLRWGNVLSRTTMEYKKCLLFRKTVENPEAGKIQLVLQPVDVGADQNMAVLLDQLEAIVTSPAPEPLKFQGERSPIFAFEAEQRVQGTQLVNGWQMKGFLFKPRHEGVIGFPPNQEYRGVGANPVITTFRKNGVFVPSQAKTRVCGTMTFDEVIFEMFYPYLLSRKTKRVSPSFGMGEFLSRPFKSSTEHLRTGFVIHFMEGTDRLRTPDFVQKILDQIQDPVLQSRILTKVYETIGKMLSEAHELGVAMGQPHLDNFSFRLREEDPAAMIEEEARMHDFDIIIWRADQTWPSFYGYTLFDLCAVSLMNVMAQEENGNVDIERASRRAARAEGVTVAEARANLETIMNYGRIFSEASVVQAKPLPTLFRSYFSSQEAKLAEQRDTFVNGVAENLSSNILEYLQASDGNPFQGIYNQSLLRQLLFGRSRLLFTPLLLNKKLENLNPNALV